MCDMIKERIRINKILNEAISSNVDRDLTKLDELTQLCFAALQVHYHGQCVDECLEATAREFAARRIARRNWVEASAPPALSNVA
ncbi:hypothetical protein RZS28_05840 [Methylocapsa polymorpha]|uniref:Uncharacterized protein n=1 Tax=Methylocapsa polymorpha TaxID=3080828 RepID=A0ABZ0HV76_9HYPH|nr:hypothetical protein RZS28_05840 [Methylocapsa sp. RX1]